MRMIFNHEDGQQVTQRGIIAAAQNRRKVEKQLEEMRKREQQEERENEKKRQKNKQNRKKDKLLGKRGAGDLDDDGSHNKRARRSHSQGKLDETESEESDQENSASGSEDADMNSDDKGEMEDAPMESNQTSLSEMTDNNSGPKKEGFNANMDGSYVGKDMGAPGSTKDREMSKPQPAFPKGLELKASIQKKTGHKSSKPMMMPGLLPPSNMG